MQCKGKGVAYTRKEPQNYSIKFYFVQYNSLVKIPKVGKDIDTRYILTFTFLDFNPNSPVIHHYRYSL